MTMQPVGYNALETGELWRIYTHDRTNVAVRNILVERNMPLVWSYVRRTEAPPGDIDDLIQEMSLVLIQAVERYEPESGNAFSTYAMTLIKWEVLKDQEKRMGGGSIARGRKIRTIHRIKEDALKRGDTMPTTGEIAEQTRYRADYVESYQRMFSIRPFEYENEEGKRIEFAGFTPVHPAEVFGNRELLEMGLRTVHPVYREVICGVYLEGKTLQEIGKKLGVCRERVRKLVQEGIYRIRRNFDRKGITLDE